jgi:hypothetical protein
MGERMTGPDTARLHMDRPTNRMILNMACWFGEDRTRNAPPRCPPSGWPRQACSHAVTASSAKARSVFASDLVSTVAESI